MWSFFLLVTQSLLRFLRFSLPLFSFHHLILTHTYTKPHLPLLQSKREELVSCCGEASLVSSSSSSLSVLISVKNLTNERQKFGKLERRKKKMKNYRVLH
ncbi:hypothetical protein I3842_12G005300 [Carya illinoinensis]|uniref:Secreted protein n=1 Tax=Carya illinoinensis TaxID=32201 RepID=A0A922IVB8_CARIL|nr:hypothetical protein I3842_12G005300 [Carya illinoinensis]